MTNRKEIAWKDIEGYEGKYRVSNQGQVMSMNYNNTGAAKLMTPHTNNNSGYAYVSLYINGKLKQHLIHRLVLNAFQPIPNASDYQVDHINNNRLDNSLENLRWATRDFNNSRPHAIKMRSINAHKLPHADEFIRGMNNGTVVYFRNQADAANQIGCSKVLITKAVNKEVPRAKGWILNYVPRSECVELANEIEEEKNAKVQKIEQMKRKIKELKQNVKDKLKEELQMRQDELKKELRKLNIEHEKAKANWLALGREITRIRNEIASLEYNEQKWKLHAIKQYTMDGEFVKEWKTAFEIKKELGLDVRPVINGLKDSVGGFKWEYSVPRQ